jgi:hypothetical protein
MSACTIGWLTTPTALSLGVHNLQLSWLVCEEVGVRLRDKLALIRLLHKVLVALLVGEVDGILLGLELDPVAVHEVSRRLPAHQRILPSVALGEHVPVH